MPTGADKGIWRRLRLIPFTVTIPDNQQDRHLLDKLRAELPGIFAWAVRGCLDWQKQGLGCPEEVRIATHLYRLDMDMLADFIVECCLTDRDHSVSAGELYPVYIKWAERNGERLMSRKALGQRLAERGFTKRRTNTGTLYVGLSLSDTNKQRPHRRRSNNPSAAEESPTATPTKKTRGPSDHRGSATKGWFMGAVERLRGGTGDDE